MNRVRRFLGKYYGRAMRNRKAVKIQEGMRTMNEVTVTKHGEGIWILTENAPGTAVDAYLVCGSERAVLIDALQEAAGIYQKVRELTKLPVDLVLTHGHFDHIGAAREFTEAGCSVFMESSDLPLLSGSGSGALAQEAVMPLKDGQVFELGGRALETILVPGHTPGSAIFLDREDHLVFSGDSFGSGPIWLQLPYSLPLSRFQENLEAALARLKEIPDLLFLPGHRNQSPGELRLEYVHDLLDTVKAVRGGSLRGETETMSAAGQTIPYAVVAHGSMLGLFYSPEHIEE